MLSISSFAATVGETLSRASQAAPIALVLDDLELADIDSLRLLQWLARNTRSSRILLAAAFCNVGTVDDHPAFAGMLQALTHDRLVEQLALGRLSLEETSALVAELMGQHVPSDEFASFVYRRTKGIPRLVEAMVWSLGGRLQLQGEVGSGSTGRVFRAFDSRTDREVAAKLILAREGIDLSDLLRFQREGVVLASLDHSNIVKVYDTFAEEHAACIIMELLDGQSLATMLERGPMALPQAKTVALQTAEALAYAHSRSIVHRDVKPDNVMVIAGDNVKVTDFGIARVLRTDNSLATLATTGMRAGTPSYMAPEQIAGKETDGRADVYALGAMLFHMVAGRPPFEGPDKLSIAVKHLQDEPVAPSSINPKVPRDWDDLILKALQKDPARRFQSAGEMQASIGLLSEKPGNATHRSARGRTILALAAASVAILFVLAVTLLHFSPSSHASGLSGKVDGYLTRLADQRHLSGTVLVSQHGRVVLDKGYGLAKRRPRAAARATTKYPVAGFTSMLSLTDILRGISTTGATFGWSTPICTHLPTCPGFWRPITVRMLLDGTANIPHTDSMGRAGNTPDQSLASCQSVSLDGRPGSKIDYENCGDLVMGLLAERALGGGSWVDQFNFIGGIFDLAGMKNTGRMTDALALSPGMALSYDGPVPFGPQIFNDDYVAYSTASDINTFDNAFFGRKLLSRSATAMVLTPRRSFSKTGCCAFPDLGIAKPQWGYEWKTGLFFGKRVFYTFRGESSAFQTVNMHFPKRDLTVVVLSNDESNDALGIAMNAAALAFGRRISQPAPVQTSFPAGLLGTYRKTITARDIRVVAQDPNQGNLINGLMTMRVKRGWLDFGFPGVTSGAGDEYFSATSGGKFSLLRYTPTNGGGCSDIATEQPPYAHYRWRRQGNYPIITPAGPDFCADRRIVEGRWRKIA